MESQQKDEVVNEKICDSSTQTFISLCCQPKMNFDNYPLALSLSPTAQRPLTTTPNEREMSVNSETAENAKMNDSEHVKDKDSSEMTQTTEYSLKSRMHEEEMPPLKVDQHENNVAKRSKCGATRTVWPMIQPIKKELHLENTQESSRHLNASSIFSNVSTLNHSPPRSRPFSGTTFENQERENVNANGKPVNSTSEYRPNHFHNDQEIDAGRISFLLKTLDGSQSLSYEGKPAAEDHLNMHVSSIRPLEPFRRHRDLEVYNDPVMRGLESLTEVLRHKQEEYRRRYTRELDTLQKFSDQLNKSLSYH